MSPDTILCRAISIVCQFELMQLPNFRYAIEREDGRDLIVILVGHTVSAPEEAINSEFILHLFKSDNFLEFALNAGNT